MNIQQILDFNLTDTLPHLDLCILSHSKNGEGKDKCSGKLQMWSYNFYKEKCVKFTYGGCLGNENRFDSKEACEDKCLE